MSARALPDTTSNQAQWPQVTSQQPGCGFPLVHLMGFFCLSSGALLRATHGAWKDHEMRLFALLRGTLRRGDVLVADRGFWSFANLAFLPLRGVDLIVRAKYANTLDWRQGQRLGKNDSLVTDQIRRLMLESSLLLGTPIERQSFKGTVDTLRVWRETLAAPGHAFQRTDGHRHFCS